MVTPMLHPMNVATIYTAACSRLPWTAEQLRPYVVHSYQDTSKPDTWFFDTFLLLDFKVRRGSSDAEVQSGAFLSKVGLKEDWQNLINSYFSPINGNTNSVLKRLDDCIAAAKLELGEPSFKHRVFLSIPEPVTYIKYTDVHGAIHGKHILSVNDPHAYLWGTLPAQNSTDDINVIFSRKPQNNSYNFEEGEPSCVLALKWFVDTCVTAWNQAHLQNLELAGFHYIGEGNPGLYVAFDTLKDLRSYISTEYPGLSLSISFYYGTYKPDGVWNSNGQWETYRSKCHNTYDFVFGQPNYSLGGGHDSRTALDMYNLINQAQQYVNGESNTTIKTREGIVVEMDNSCVHDLYSGTLLPTPHCRTSFYLHVLAGKNELNLLYYMGESLLANAYDAPTNASHGNLPFSAADYRLFDHLAAFVTNRRRAEALARVNVDQNEILDIQDLNVILNVMQGTDTDPNHVARADVNRDGVVDINDYNIVQNAMLNGLNL